MAASVSSNSFLLTTTYRSKLRNSKNPRQLTVFAKTVEPSSDNESRTNPFKFDWGKMSDMKSLIPVVSTPPSFGGLTRKKDSGTVFVAGATGLAGARIAQVLLREGFKFRAGVPDLGVAQELARFALDYKVSIIQRHSRGWKKESLYRRKIEAEEAAKKAAEEAEEAEKVKSKLDEEVIKPSEQELLAPSLAKEAKQKAEQAGASVDNLLAKAKGFGSSFSWDKLSSQVATAVKTTNSETEKVKVATVRGQAKARNLSAKKAVVKQATQNTKQKSKPSIKKRTQASEPNGKEVRNIFGGLFKQKTIYVDDV